MTGRLCGLPHYQYTESACTEPAGHYQRDADPHAGPLIIDGQHCGGLAWDEPKGHTVPDKPTPEAASLLLAALRGETPAIICYAKCEPCMHGFHYDDPEPHPWAGPEDVEHARATGQPEPTGNRGCHCARTTP